MFLNFVSTTVPPYKISQKNTAEELKKRMGVRPALLRIIDSAVRHSGIDTRHLVVPDAEPESGEKFYSKNGNYFSPGTEARMQLYEKWSADLAGEAAEIIFNSLKYNPDNIGRLITVSCTGFFAPGIDYNLIKRFGLNSRIKRTHIGFMGCAAAVVAFNSVLEAGAMLKDNEDILVLALELCSIHLQTEPTRDNILANTIFADGCAAALFSRRKINAENAFSLLSADSILFPDSHELMKWNIGNNGFDMTLSSEIPGIILKKACPELIEMLKKRGLDIRDVKFWALHPGGRAILDALQEGLSLDDNDMVFSREVLSEYGNMSSVTILFVLKEIINSGKASEGDYCCAVAFGPGLTMEAAVFRFI